MTEPDIPQRQKDKRLFRGLFQFIETELLLCEYKSFVETVDVNVKLK